MRFLFLLSLTLASTTWAADIAWPANARTPAKVQEQTVEFDGIQIPTCTLIIADTKFELSYFGKFSRGMDDPKWNTTFIIAEQPAIRWGIAGFNKGEFLPSLTAENLLSYVASLKAQGATSVLSTADNQLSESVMIAGNKAELVEYVKKGQRTREYFIEHEGKIFVFGYQAPVKIFDSHAETARIIFSRVVLR